MIPIPFINTQWIHLTPPPVSLVPPTFRLRGNSRPGNLPIRFLCKCAGVLVHCNLTDDVTKECIPMATTLVRFKEETKQFERVIHAACARLGYCSLHREQEVLKNFVSGKDVFVSLPTGGGKSLCYTLLPFIFDKVRQKLGWSKAIIVSPLIALNKNQVQCTMNGGLRNTI